MLNFAQLETVLKRDEGFRSEPYLDSEGNPTIGYGATRILGVPVTLDMPPITKQVARDLLRSDIYTALVDAQALFSRFSEMNGVRQAVLVNMAFNLGRGRLSRFRNLINAANRLSYSRVADEMQYRNPPHPELTPWYVQTGFRGERLVEEMRLGVA